MHAQSRPVTVVFNGEIYNAQELRRQLEGQGGRFVTDHSDTEVVAEGFALWGTALFSRLDGMFAAAIWDSDKRELILVRDHVGIKPLYYAYGNRGEVLFASEIKSLVASGAFDPEFDEASLIESFSFRAPMAPRTTLKAVRSVEPGTYLRMSVGEKPRRTERYWNVLDRLQDAETVSQPDVERALASAVESHLISDVPVGVFLSGGVDSSLVTALAAQRGPITGFCISSSGPSDETTFAAVVADALGIPLHVRRITEDELFAELDHWAYFNDIPVADPSAVALMLLCRDVASAGVRVMLSGEGADELFGGYRAYYRFTMLHRIPPVLQRVLAPLASDYRTREYLESGSREFFGTAHVSDARVRARLVRAQATLSAHSTSWDSLDGISPLRRAMMFDQLYRLHNDVLARTDTATMAASIEARVPFLSKNIIRLANRLPDSDCVGWDPRQTKRLLKQITAKFVPRDVVYRKKIGFDLPIASWLRSRFREQIEDKLSRREFAEINYAEMRAVYGLLLSGVDSWAPLVWSWMALEQWRDAWLRPSGGVRPHRLPDSIPQDDRSLLESALVRMVS
jgi:asparagine synthase (glutamine-hydrolysing)